jgi:mycothiol system anti-sigma-R factor
MLCDDVKRVVYFFLDGTLGPRRTNDLDEHLNLCPDCQKRLSVQRRLRTFVQNRLERICAPDRFKTRLTRSLRAIV